MQDVAGLVSSIDDVLITGDGSAKRSAGACREELACVCAALLAMESLAWTADLCHNAVAAETIAVTAARALGRVERVESMVAVLRHDLETVAGNAREIQTTIEGTARC